MLKSDAGRSIKFARRKSLSILRTFLRARILRIFFKYCQSNLSFLVKWTQLISADFSFQILSILWLLNLGGLSDFFFEKSRSNVCEKFLLTKHCSGGFTNPLHSPRNEHSKTEFGKKNSETKDRRIGDFFQEQIWLRPVWWPPGIPLYMYIHTYINVHTYECAHIHIHIHTYIYTYTHTYAYVCIHLIDVAFMTSHEIV